ncbi:ketoacyl-ACP synthase III [Reichenbachiella agarivorans]|uniref:Beta-ketoacyl-[acyl-carrier-protein] synthase III n=1 Tax=Reichenbachiella agarivorans TaxID=2979464 RepID=A0ABY6CR98_9BACT|nr:beta-ketoacyl-ACP synthase III [Reichenbachiella agarivorans]UXP33035.1 ketoacyl-ACP synthase III [Reichenbachiella agarivorans]
MKQARIIGTGHYVPANVVKNADLEALMDTNDAWIQERTGIKERRHIVPGGEDTTSTMGAKASQMAIQKAGVTVDEIDFIIFATLSPDYYFPGPGVMLQKQLGFKKEIGALDVRNQCSGFIYSLSVADQFIKTGMYKTILVVGSEVHSGGLDMTTRGRGVSVIFGDGAGAIVMQATNDKDKGVLSTHLHAEGQFAEELALIAPATTDWIPNYIERNDPEDIRYYPYMNGNFVFKNAVVRFQEVINEALEANHCSADQIDLLIPHQANLRISQFIQKQMNLSDDRVFNNIQKYGNTTAASIPLALSEAVEQGKVKSGDLLCLAAFGSGFTWASALIRW